MTHTPGEWVQSPIKLNQICAVNGDEIELIAECPFNWPADKERWEIVAANARLITTAPDGLALAHMVIDTATVETPPALIEAANALINKAKGQP